MKDHDGADRWKDNIKLVPEATCEVGGICLGYLIKILFPKNIRFSWIAKRLLASQERPCCVKFIAKREQWRVGVAVLQQV